MVNAADSTLRGRRHRRKARAAGFVPKLALGLEPMAVRARQRRRFDASRAATQAESPRSGLDPKPTKPSQRILFAGGLNPMA